MTERAKNEIVKENSRLLRGGIADGLTHVETGARTTKTTRCCSSFTDPTCRTTGTCARSGTKKKLEKAFSFMIRLRLPGGHVTPGSGEARRHSGDLCERHAASDDARDIPVSWRHSNRT